MANILPVRQNPDLNFVGDKQDAVLVENLLNLPEVVLNGGTMMPPSPITGSAMNAADDRPEGGKPNYVVDSSERTG